jgi:hypothetical protein
MTVGAHELALRNLLQDAPFASAHAHEPTYFGDLHRSGKVIPLHRRGMEHPAAVRAGPAGLQAPIPRGELQSAQRLLSQASLAGPGVVRGIVRAATFDAPGLEATPSPVELVNGFSMPHAPHRFMSSV